MYHKSVYITYTCTYVCIHVRMYIYACINLLYVCFEGGGGGGGGVCAGIWALLLPPLCFLSSNSIHI